MDMENHAMVRAEVLTEALPYIQKFRDDIVVIKFGGSAMENPELTRRTMRDIVLSAVSRHSRTHGVIRTG